MKGLSPDRKIKPASRKQFRAFMRLRVWNSLKAMKSILLQTLAFVALHSRRAFAAAIFFLLLPSLAQAKTYYLSPTGTDSGSGQSSGTAWLSPNHALNCGDVIVAAASSHYSSANFTAGKWGTVSCPAANAVVWLRCATFDACKIHASTNPGMWIDQSYWGVQGWEVTTTAGDAYGPCFVAQPNYATPTSIHHVIFANDIANGCSQGGFVMVNKGHAGVDYFVVVGSIAYNAAQGTGSCASGIAVYQPIQSDTSPGTHLYIAGNFSYNNVEPSKCAGKSPTAGEGILFDSFDGSQGGVAPYWSQAVAVNNIVVNNGAKGIEIDGNSVGSYHSTIWLNHNTSWGNLTDPNQSWLGCSEISLSKARNTHLNSNLVSTSRATGCGGHPIYALGMAGGDSSDSAAHNFAYGYNGNSVFLYDSPSFSWGQTNQFGISPNFIKPEAPAAPRCGGTSNVPSCVAPVIADFVPKTASAAGLGYQKPSSTPIKDELFPRWLCTASLPAGLVTMGCN
jgi:hypothetical protein